MNEWRFNNSFESTPGSIIDSIRSMCAPNQGQHSAAWDVVQ